MKKSYVVTVPVFGWVDVSVTAESEEEAEQNAVREFCTSDSYDCGCVYDVSVSDDGTFDAEEISENPKGGKETK
ncbi:MAG: hypothetical protein ACI4D6_01525 [Chordicoccus sp.]